MNLPVQPLYMDGHGIMRFRGNTIVRHLLDLCTENGLCDLNKIAVMGFSQEEEEQFAQLIGYSLSGFGKLSYVTDETYARAARQRKRKP